MSERTDPTFAAVWLFTIAACMFLAPAAAAAIAWVADRAADRAEAKRREIQGREVSAEWLAVLAATDEPIFAELWAESLRRDLEEWA